MGICTNSTCLLACIEAGLMSMYLSTAQWLLKHPYRVLQHTCNHKAGFAHAYTTVRLVDFLLLPCRLAGELGAHALQGPGSLRVALIDNLFGLTQEQVLKGIKLRETCLWNSYCKIARLCVAALLFLHMHRLDFTAIRWTLPLHRLLPHRVCTPHFPIPVGRDQPLDVTT